MMNSNDLAIRVENISKRYRIGIKEEMRDNFAGAFFAFIKSPLRNYRRYRSLYKFESIGGYQANNDSEDVIWALRDISFEVQKGEVLGIIGRNGAGKSTLLKILCKVTDPTSGAAEIRGRVSSLLEVGTGFHQELTGRENIYLNGTILGMTKKEVDRKFGEIVDFSGVEKFIDTPVKRYSSGMRVRLAFSVAAYLEPEILLIDEVLAVGDADFQKKCLKKMEDVGKKGRTVIFVSHNMPAVNRLCHRALLLENGRLVDDGLASKIINKYLYSDKDTSAVREWKDPQTAPSSPIARLRAVRIRNADGKIADSIDIRSPTKIEMEYEVQESGHILLPHFVLHDEKGATVFVTVDQDPEWRKRPRPKGYFISSVLIPGNLLAEGPHFVNCHLITLNPDVKQFSEHNAVSFTVVDSLDGDSARGDYAGNFPGVVRPLLNWITEYNSHMTQNDEIKSE